MATDKKHIAVYLAPEIEQALITFCQEKGLISKKGTMFSAGVNAALAQFFERTDTTTSNTPAEVSNTPSGAGNTPQKVGNTLITGNILASAGNIPDQSVGNILAELGNIPSESLALEGLPGKF
jgi:hypothetical protein